MKKEKKLPRISLCVLGLIILSSVFAGVLAPYSMEEMNPAAINLAPSAAHIFGTDSMGRDLFTMVLYGGRASIYIGLLSACISTAVAVVYGTVSGLAGERLCLVSCKCRARQTQDQAQHQQQRKQFLRVLHVISSIF